MQQPAKSGFTLPELMAGMLIFSMLSLTVGLMLQHAWRAWNTSNTTVAMLRDLSVAQTVLRREIRRSGMNDITISNGRIDFPARGVRSQSGAESVYRSGKALIHSGPNGVFTLVPDAVSEFRAEKGQNEVTVAIACRNDAGIEEHQSITVYTRN